MQIFDPQKGLVDTKSVIRDVSQDLVNAENIIKGLKEKMMVEDIVKLVQQTCALTNGEVFDLVTKVSDEIQKEVGVEDILISPANE